MNNKIRAWHQERIEVRILKSAANLNTNKKVLEIGCGNGFGTYLIWKYFQPREIQAIDLDPRMIWRARKRYGSIAHFKVASVTDLPFSDDQFDAVINFGIIHHVPIWERAIEECARVLKHKGKFISEDLAKETWRPPIGRLFKLLADHPYDLMYKISEFISALKRNNFQLEYFQLKYPHIFPFFSLVAIKQ